MALDGFSRRERQIMDVLYARGEATAGDVLEAIADPSGYSSIRTLLRVLEEKGHVVRAGKSGRAVVYKPATARSIAQRSAIRRLLETFFNGSIEDGVAALLSGRARQPTDQELDRLAQLVRRARKKRR
jgi:BlaI family transcriptional regulator, penicillinase repressor